jgi:hypothetical protein
MTSCTIPYFTEWPQHNYQLLLCDKPAEARGYLLATNSHIVTAVPGEVRILRKAIYFREYI